MSYPKSVRGGWLPPDRRSGLSEVNQMELAGLAHARTEDPSTAKDAAAAVEGKRAGRLEAQVLVALRRNTFLTAWEIASIAGIEYGSTSPRLINLEKKNLVFRAGSVTRGGRRRSILWRAV